MRSYSKVSSFPDGSEFDRLAPFLLSLMLRNVASSGYRFEDPTRSGTYSLAGCVIASPSYPENLETVDQNYVFNWTRDAAITAVELVHAPLPVDEHGVKQSLVDYVLFAEHCQQHTRTLGCACYTVDGLPREWSDQSDGPALQTIAILDAFGVLDAAGQDAARRVIARNLDYLLQVYRAATTSLWEEVAGQSLFARSVQLECFRRITENDVEIAMPAGLDEAISWLDAALDTHWNGECLVSVVADKASGESASVRAGYDPNIDVVLAALHGSLSVGDPRLLATAARLRATYSDVGAETCYPINVEDQARDMGPLIGRYPSDTYDGDLTDDVTTVGHPWALCTSAMAQLYFEVSGVLAKDGSVLSDQLAAPFFEQVGVDEAMATADARDCLVEAGDRMLRAIVFHSDHLELSEQFDATTGFQKSVANLTWSYASFLSAVRARDAAAPR